MRNKIVALLTGLLIPVIAFCGLEAGTYISDLVATNPLGSDLASTIDDHIRLVKSTIKTTFPNINGAISSTDEELSLLAGKTGTVWTSANDGVGSTLDADLLDGVSSSGYCVTGGTGCPGGITGFANPTGTIGLSAVNGSAATAMRSDGAPALSQSIAPTMTGVWTFTKVATTGADVPIYVSSSFPRISLNETSGAANNKLWHFSATGEQLVGGIEDDAHTAASNWLTVDRTGTTVDAVAFPADGTGGVGGLFRIGTANTSSGLSNSLATIRTTTSGNAALNVRMGGATNSAGLSVHNELTSGDNNLVVFLTDTATVRGSITYDRGGGLILYGATSDARLKKNFKPSASARSVIDCIQIESYDWRETGNHVEHGVVAQRLDKCAPYAVSKGKVWQVDKSTLIPALIKYTQELEQRLARLEANAARRH